MSTVGGQAVLEGVMMRGPGNWAVAVRKPNGSIAQVCRPIESAMARHRVFRLPVIRGVMALGESLAIGFRALAISANYASQDATAEEAEEVETELSRGALIFAFAVAIGFAVMLFKVTPALITNWLPIRGTGYFVMVEGAIRVTISQYQAGRPKNANTKIAITITQSRKAVPQRGWIRLYRCTVCGVSSSPAS